MRIRRLNRPGRLVGIINKTILISDINTIVKSIVKASVITLSIRFSFQIVIE